MSNHVEFDLYADEHEPVASYNQTVYHLTVPREVQMTIPTGKIPIVYVGVDTYGLVEIVSYSWFGEYSSQGKANAVLSDIFTWLVEWEFAEWRAIGPEDNELFATAKLTDLPAFIY